MKIITCFFTLLLTLSAFAAKPAVLTINWKFTNVIEGYDHQNKMVVYIDGQKIAESGSFAQSQQSQFIIGVPAGKHALKVVCEAFYEGHWEEHLRANEYSIDALYETEATLKGNMKLDMVFDIDTELADIRFGSGSGKAKVEKTKGTPVTIAWVYRGVEDGYDHQSRLEVTVDGKHVATSKVMRQTQKGTLTIKIPQGQHTLVIEGYALYEGNWEQHLKDNDYSIDALYETTLTVTKASKRISLVFDLDKGTEVVE